MTAQELFAKAADLIEERGWFNGHYPGFDTIQGTVCAGIALSAVYDTSWDVLSEARIILAKHIGWSKNQPVDYLGAIYEWNDSSDEKTVVATLRELAAT